MHGDSEHQDLDDLKATLLAQKKTQLRQLWHTNFPNETAYSR